MPILPRLGCISFYKGCVMQKLTVLVTGASGFIGSHLLPFLLERQYKVSALTRQKNKVSDHPDLTWVNDFEQMSSQKIDYVINLAGENIGQKRWTEQRKQQLIESRVSMTQRLYEWLDQGFQFQYPDLKSALTQILGRD